MSELPEWARGIDDVDLATPNPARIYDFYLGGSHNFGVDREVGERVLKIVPQGPRIAGENRAFLGRGVRHLLDQGIRQFLDLGSGIATVGNVHEVALSRAPEARVVYVDREPVAVAHSRAILADVPNATIVHADLRDVDTVLAAAAESLDLTRPVGLLMVAVLHFLPGTDDDGDPAAVIARYTNALADGSHLLASHFTAEFDPGTAEQLLGVYRNTAQPMLARTRTELQALLTTGGMQLIDPGVVHLPEWRPDGPYDTDTDERLLIGGASLLRRA